jgi:hypothetical protein
MNRSITNALRMTRTYATDVSIVDGMLATTVRGQGPLDYSRFHRLHEVRHAIEQGKLRFLVGGPDEGVLYKHVWFIDDTVPEDIATAMRAS